MPTLAAPPGVDLAAYGAQLRERFRNPALPHRTQQIAMDGSQKLPQRLLATVRERLAGGGSIAHLALAIAGWIRYASGTDEAGQADRRRRSAGGEVRGDRRGGARQSPRRSPTAFSISSKCSATIFPRNATFRRAVSRDVGGARSATACAARSRSHVAHHRS